MLDIEVVMAQRDIARQRLTQADTEVALLRSAITRLSREFIEACQERDAARAALRWLVGRYREREADIADVYGYGGGITDAELKAHVAPHLGESA